MNSFVSLVLLLATMAGGMWMLEQRAVPLTTQRISSGWIAIGLLIRVVLSFTLIVLAGLAAEALGVYS
jgi:hypothetical protein